MGREMRWVLLLAAAMMAFGCDDGAPTDAGVDASVVDGGGDDAGPDGGPMGEEIALPGLDGPVEVVIDDRGMPHIYASTVHDLMVVEGYLMSRDRFAQMELIRRNVLGTLAEVLYNADPSVLGDDRDSRFLGFMRQGRAIYESLPADDETRLAAEAFVEGVNHYIDQVLDTDEYLPPMGLELINIVRASPNFGHWDPADVFAIARFQ
ncbi:MAG TPA: hypothetical protein DEF51_45715, partial [Myxococcales bacterium]|nr:hypothetical protein [Myxococcales bacterium]